MLIGWLRAGPLGALVAWLGFTLPSAVIMASIALLLPSVTLAAGWMHGLLLVAAAAVASAILTMREKLAPDLIRLAIAAGVFVLVTFVPIGAIDPLAIAAAAIVGTLFVDPRIVSANTTLDLGVSKRTGAIALALLAAVFVLLELWSATGSHAGMLANTVFRTGALVFGGGHVVLPLLETQVAQAGIVDSQTVVAGYAAAQAMPGPLFTIASYVGASAFGRTLGWGGALLGTVSIFAPSFFLLTGIAPFYRALGDNRRFRSALAGANAGVIGLLASAFVHPIWTTAVRSWIDVAVVAVAFAALHFGKVPAWAIVLLGACAGFLLER
jgi:chromate transporter